MSSSFVLLISSLVLFSYTSMQCRAWTTISSSVNAPAIAGTKLSLPAAAAVRVSKLWSSPPKDASAVQEPIFLSEDGGDPDESAAAAAAARKFAFKLQGKLLKEIRNVCLQYNMLEEGDHIMVCVSGGKDSATLLYLLQKLQRSLPISFQLTAVHVDQKQPGYNGAPLVEWLEDLQVPYEILEEDTYSIVVDKTQEGKSFCAVCSRLRRGILYTAAARLGCNKIALGHHGDDAVETLLLNMMHGGQLKGMPARYASKRHGLAVMRPLINSLESDIRDYAELQKFPILPCNLCSNQASLQRPQVKLLLASLESMNHRARANILNAMSAVRPSHLLDQELRKACGLDPITGDAGKSSGSDEFYFDDEDSAFLDE